MHIVHAIVTTFALERGKPLQELLLVGIRAIARTTITSGC